MAGICATRERRAKSRLTLSILLMPLSEVSSIVPPAWRTASAVAVSDSSGKSNMTSEREPDSRICAIVLILYAGWYKPTQATRVAAASLSPGGAGQ